MTEVCSRTSGASKYESEIGSWLTDVMGVVMAGDSAAAATAGETGVPAATN